MVPILRFHFFSISYQTAYYLFCFGPFLEKLPFSVHQLFPSPQFYVVRKRFVLEKNVASVNFLFRAKMADEIVYVDRLLLCVYVCNGCYLLSSNCKLSKKDVAKCNQRVKKSIGTDPSILLVEIAVRTTG